MHKSTQDYLKVHFEICARDNRFRIAIPTSKNWKLKSARVKEKELEGIAPSQSECLACSSHLVKHLAPNSQSCNTPDI